VHLSLKILLLVATILVTERHYQVVERQTQVAERRSGPFRLNLTTGLRLPEQIN